MLRPIGIQEELAERTHGRIYRSIGSILVLVSNLELTEAIDQCWHLLKIHLPYQESDHVSNLACNALCDATCLEDLELRRNDEVRLDAVNARRIPRSHHGRRILPPLSGPRRPLAPRSGQRNAADGPGSATARVCPPLNCAAPGAPIQHDRHPRQANDLKCTWASLMEIVPPSAGRRLAGPGSRLMASLGRLWES